MSIEDGAKKFTSGFLDHYEPPFKKLQKQLADLVARQNTALLEIESENRKFRDVNSSELNSVFQSVKEYQMRLMNVKKEMNDLTERSVRLKKRAIKLQEFKQREALENAHYIEAQLKREEDLIARPTPKIHSEASTKQ